ncbi:Phospholipase A(2) protein [Dioscorea alata]|uniref:Phospholipase A(2) protein n=1 Tax=Dioscorea alata TaxID=55571 RepID=A0ACB7VRK5_DIOAL|nr:Phospholipase A(2) protein [Dioscorea alata]
MAPKLPIWNHHHRHHQLPFFSIDTILRLIPSWPFPNPRAPSSPQPVPRPPERGCSLPLFRPYVAKVPWHGGVRAFLSQLFPRYGHYCGPNWSSGKDGGSMLWDRRPIDWLDFCCYCHDIGYDTHDQAKLLKADLAFLECLERPRMATKGDPSVALLYKSMCIAGLRNILIPYRMQLVRLQAGPSVVDMLGSLIGRSMFFKQNLNPKTSA